LRVSWRLQAELLPQPPANLMSRCGMGTQEALRVDPDHTRSREGLKLLKVITQDVAAFYFDNESNSVRAGYGKG
jgi:hypothetical protein